MLETDDAEKKKLEDKLKTINTEIKIQREMLGSKIILNKIRNNTFLNIVPPKSSKGEVYCFNVQTKEFYKLKDGQFWFIGRKYGMAVTQRQEMAKIPE